MQPKREIMTWHLFTDYNNITIQPPSTFIKRWAVSMWLKIKTIVILDDTLRRDIITQIRRRYLNTIKTSVSFLIAYIHTLTCVILQNTRVCAFTIWTLKQNSAGVGDILNLGQVHSLFRMKQCFSSDQTKSCQMQGYH